LVGPLKRIRREGEEGGGQKEGPAEGRMADGRREGEGREKGGRRGRREKGGRREGKGRKEGGRVEYSQQERPQQQFS
jgi:hypothetical protein